jgi:ParB-like chromosome segregation protein Spo0J
MDNITEKFDKYLFVTQDTSTMANPLEIKTASPFKDLFPVKQNDLERVMASMKAKGYDNGHPIILWEGHDLTVVDGHTRLAAAQKLLFARIPVILKKFKDEAEALEYAIESQVNRRNLTDAELLNCLTELDKRKKTGPAKSLASREAKLGKSAEQTAALLGVSRAKVERLRTVSDHATDEIKDAVKDGKLSLNKAYKATMDARHAEEDSNEADSDDIKVDRLLALENSYCCAIAARTDRELKQYPDIRYSAKELVALRKKIVEKLDAELNRFKGNN